MVICVPPTLESPGRTTRYFCMASGSNFPRPIMSTPYPQRRDNERDNASTTAQPPTPVTTPVTTPDADAWVHRFSPETRQGYRPATLIQRFNNKSLNWPAWFRHFRAVADVHGWTNEQRALQLVSYWVTVTYITTTC